MVLGLPSLWLFLTLQGRKHQRHSGSVPPTPKSLRISLPLSIPTLSQPFFPLPQLCKGNLLKTLFFNSRGPSLKDLMASVTENVASGL